MRLHARPHGKALIVAVLGGLHSVDAAFLPAAGLNQELHVDAAARRRDGPAQGPHVDAAARRRDGPVPGATRMNSLEGGATLSSSKEALQVRSSFTSGRGILGEAVPSGNPRHPFWQFEGHHLSRSRAYICSVVLFLAGILCAAGGIGGGGIYVTLLMVAGKLGVADAVPLSKAIVFFGSISSWVLNSRKLVSWETKRETAIDYNICRLVVPGSLSGTLIGVILNRRLPSWIILAVLSAILVAITISVGWTTVKLHLEEWAQDLEDERVAQEVAKEVVEAARAANAKLRASAVHSYSPQEPKQGAEGWSAGVGGLAVVPPANRPGTSIFEKPRRASGVRRPSMNAPDITKMRNRMLWSDIGLSLGILFIVITFGVFRFHVGECVNAGFVAQSKICNHPVLFWLGQGTLESWMHSSAIPAIRVLTIAVPLCLCVALQCYYARLLVKYEGWHPGDVVVYCVVSMFTGCLSGLVGIGGGLIFSPFFLLSGVHPSVAVATSSTCVIFTSASTSLQYLLTDRIIVSLTLVYGAVSLAASYLGTSFVHFLEERFWGRKSYVSLIVGLGVLVSTVLSIVKLACTRPQ